MILIFIILIIYVFAKYNSIIQNKNKVKQAESGIDVYLTQRFDLIPNLVECVKGYMKHEKEMLTEITKARTAYLQNKNLKEGQELNKKCNMIIAVAEEYPELRSSEQFLNLQKNLSKVENQLQAARRVYNSEVNTYNNSIQKFPGNIMASIFGFKEEEYFEAEYNSRENIKIKDINS